MSKLDDAFKNKPIFMPYFPLGYPTLDVSVDVIEALAKNGANVVEVGLSFSDPLADGPVVQRATQVALDNGITISKALAAVTELRQRGVTTPLILMGYYNPMLAYGLTRFVADASAAGADGFIIPDLPLEEAEEFQAVLSDASTASLGNGSPLSALPLIPMLAPTSPDERMEMIGRKAKGFIYLVSVTGITGERRDISAGLADLVARVQAHTSVPVCVGFGIGTPEQAKAVGAIADGVIVGSACVRIIGESATPVETAKTFARSFADALK
jgi:tryptophan synthase alpha chain